MREDRLLILADHLLYGSLGHKVFDFNTYNTYDNPFEKPLEGVPRGCGTHGCAIGECPVIWPEE